MKKNGGGKSHATVPSSKNLPAQKETLPHLFFDCSTTKNLILELSTRYLQKEVLSKTTFFLSNLSEIERDNGTLDIQ